MPRIHERGQVTLPKGIRDQLGLAPGDDVTIALRDDEIVIRKARSFLDARLPPRTGPYNPAAERTAYRDAIVARAAGRRSDAG